jgi:hypothetical protein
MKIDTNTGNCHCNWKGKQLPGHHSEDFVFIGEMQLNHSFCPVATYTGLACGDA